MLFFLLIDLLEDWNLTIKKQAIESLGQLGSRWAGWCSTSSPAPSSLTRQEQLKLAEQIVLVLSAMWTDSNLNIIRQPVITAIGKIVPQLPDDNTLWLEIFAKLAKNRQEILPIRLIALDTLVKFDTDEAAENIIDMLQSTPAEIPSMELTAFHALAQLQREVALDFLIQRLADLSARKQAWRNQRDLGQPVERWQYRQWETELSYAIAQIAPETTGIELLAHDLAEVRKGAWLAIREFGDTTIIETLIEKYQNSQPDAAHFRHAAFQAIDGSLITLEVKGDQPTRFNSFASFVAVH